jgi:cellulose synthase/poly-beta-1,6-N-acetylglucosamine synthase-like glycosyltransferase
MPNALFLILLAYTAVWLSVNVYNLYPLLNYHTRRKRQERGASYLPRRLPRISILIPAYHEEAVLPYSIKRIFQSDYPSKLLDVIVLTEKDDIGTIGVARNLVNTYGIKHLHVEEEDFPRGKPRALNFGLKHVTGSIIGVIDAEDIIDRKLFKKVVSLMNSGYDAVQGVLDMTNDRDGFTNMHLRAEYRYWYRTYMPALAYSNFPVPLGGTTNFFKRDVLEELKGWDPYNVTEDFDLGMRLYNEHKKVGIAFDMLGRRSNERIFRNKYNFSMMDSVTLEESPTTFMGWLRQRTRWQRGKIQTFKKVLKKPPSNPLNKIHFVLTSLVPHMGPINMTGIVYSVLIFFSGILLPPWIYYIFGFNISMFVFYCAMQGYGYFTAVHKNRRRRLLKAIFVGATTPVYWVMQWAADIRAIKHEYLGARVFWEKTAHSGAHIKKS